MDTDLPSRRSPKAVWGIVFLLIIGINRLYWGLHEPVSVATATSSITTTPKPIEYNLTGYDYYVGLYADKYASSKGQASKLRSIMHCLLNKETTHWTNQTHGDGGKAGGPLQFHQATWLRMRNQMHKAGLVDEIGSRYDLEQSIQTTIWAILNGRQMEWGPIMTGKCERL